MPITDEFGAPIYLPKEVEALFGEKQTREELAKKYLRGKKTFENLLKAYTTPEGEIDYVSLAEDVPSSKEVAILVSKNSIAGFDKLDESWQEEKTVLANYFLSNPMLTFFGTSKNTSRYLKRLGEIGRNKKFTDKFLNLLNEKYRTQIDNAKRTNREELVISLEKEKEKIVSFYNGQVEIAEKTAKEYEEKYSPKF